VALTEHMGAALAAHGYAVLPRHRDMKKNTQEVISRFAR
jgi:hypothetical protein